MAAINKMGMELEGGWRGVRYQHPFDDTTIKHDGSVHFYSPPDGAFLHYGEIISEPLDPEDLVKWAEVHCPTDVNDSCGTHMHISVKSAPMYGSLLTPTFNKEILFQLTKLNETIKDSDPETYNRFAHRLKGGNSYCKKGYKGLSQVVLDHKGSERYHQLNYCYRLKGTLEIRVFPATTNKEFLKELVICTADTIEKWIAKEHRVTKVRFRRS